MCKDKSKRCNKKGKEPKECTLEKMKEYHPDAKDKHPCNEKDSKKPEKQ